MSDAESWNARNRKVIEEFRANGGVVGGDFEGKPMIILTTKGAKSGLERVIPLVYSMDGDRYVVIASKGGAPSQPDWYYNLLEHPEITVEVGNEKFRARAVHEDGDERQRLFDQQAAQMPFFKDYERKAPRQIPVFTLHRL